ncbi:MAG: hypothetical protein NT131_05505 [Methanomassiliicoccales archaeon]|nr:hypothetical protein [Methanomassiliicoccales archaeon]
MLVNEITTHRTTLNAKIWICELQYRDHTVSEVLNEMLDRFEALGFKPN